MTASTDKRETGKENERPDKHRWKTTGLTYIWKRSKEGDSTSDISPLSIAQSTHFHSLEDDHPTEPPTLFHLTSIANKRCALKPCINIDFETVCERRRYPCHFFVIKRVRIVFERLHFNEFLNARNYIFPAGNEHHLKFFISLKRNRRCDLSESPLCMHFCFFLKFYCKKY